MQVTDMSWERGYKANSPSSSVVDFFYLTMDKDKCKCTLHHLDFLISMTHPMDPLLHQSAEDSVYLTHKFHIPCLIYSRYSAICIMQI